MNVQLSNDSKSLIITIPIAPRPQNEKGNQTVATSGGNVPVVIGENVLYVGINAFVKSSTFKTPKGTVKP